MCFLYGVKNKNDSFAMVAGEYTPFRIQYSGNNTLDHTKLWANGDNYVISTFATSQNENNMYYYSLESSDKTNLYNCSIYKSSELEKYKTDAKQQVKIVWQKQLDENLEIYIPNGPRLGTNVIEATNVAKAFGDKLLYDNLNFTLPQAGIVGIIGPNGAGKSTIFRMIMGEQRPDGGQFSIGETVKIAYVDQSHSNIDPEKSIWENFADGQELVMMGGKQVNSRAYLSRFNFGGSDQNKKVSMLSGGERNRLHLAMTLKEEGNVLLLDEPTNDLDVNTLRALEEGLENFAGCAVVISHDRWFLDRICTHILAFEGDSEVYFFEGSFSDYEENKKKRLGGDLTPKRLKYRKLIRS